MNNVALFGVGLLVTLMVAAAIALLVWGALMDGREEDVWQAERDMADPVIVSPETVGT